MLTIIGTCHVLPVGDVVRGLINEIKPGAVLIELDKHRCEQLMKPLSHSSLLDCQEVTAWLNGCRAGNDMIGAVKGAEDVGVEATCIDEEWGKSFSDSLLRVAQVVRSPIEQVYYMFSIAYTIAHVPSWLRSVKADETPERDVVLKSIFPVGWYPFGDIWLTHREKLMAKRIREISSEFSDVVVVVGAAHMENLGRLLITLSPRLISTLKDA